MINVNYTSILAGGPRFIKFWVKRFNIGSINNSTGRMFYFFNTVIHTDFFLHLLPHMNSLQDSPFYDPLIRQILWS